MCRTFLTIFIVQEVLTMNKDKSRQAIILDNGSEISLKHKSSIQTKNKNKKIVDILKGIHNLLVKSPVAHDTEAIDEEIQPLTWVIGS